MGIKLSIPTKALQEEHIPRSHPGHEFGNTRQDPTPDFPQIPHLGKSYLTDLDGDHRNSLFSPTHGASVLEQVPEFRREFPQLRWPILTQPFEELSNQVPPNWIPHLMGLLNSGNIFQGLSKAKKGKSGSVQKFCLFNIPRISML